jgi:hypothetical protein
VLFKQSKENASVSTHAGVARNLQKRYPFWPRGSWSSHRGERDVLDRFRQVSP